MPNLINTDLGQNYLKSQQSTQFGTRKLKPLVVIVSGLTANNGDSNSLFTRTIRALQQNVELYAVFEPQGDYVTVLVSSDTTPQDNTTDEVNNNRDAYLEERLLSGGITAIIWNANIYGANIGWND